MEPPEKEFATLAERIRTGSNRYEDIEQHKALLSAISDFETAHPRSEGRILRALLAQYFRTSPTAYRELVTLFEQALRRTTLAPWLRLHIMVLFAAHLQSNPRVSKARIDKLRERAYRLAVKIGRQLKAAIILNNWFFARLEDGDLAGARVLATRTEKAIAAISSRKRETNYYLQLRGRFATHSGRLALLTARTSRDRERGIRWYRSALNHEGSDPNRRLNILTETAESLLDSLEGRHDLRRVARLLEKAERSFDATVSDLNRGYYFEVSGRANTAFATEVENEDVHLFLDYMRRALNDFEKARRFYRGRPEERKMSLEIKEAKMRMKQFRGTASDISRSLARFKKAYPDASRIAFVMMRIRRKRNHKMIFAAIKGACAKHGFTALRADGGEFHPDLLQNVRTFMHGCGFGIAVLEELDGEPISTNVVLEIGYMVALNKPVCLLKDQTVKLLPSDLIGRLYRPFDSKRIPESLEEGLRSWLRQHRPLQLADVHASARRKRTAKPRKR